MTGNHRLPLFTRTTLWWLLIASIPAMLGFLAGLLLPTLRGCGP